MGSGGTGGARPLLCAPKYYSSLTCRAKVIKDYVDKALALDRKPNKAPTVDAVSEEVFGNLNETDQNELNKFGKEIAAQNRKRKIKAWKASEAHHKRRKVGRGRGKGFGRGRRARGRGQEVVEPATEDPYMVLEPPEDEPEPSAAPGPVAGSSGPRRVGGRDLENAFSYKWGTFLIYKLRDKDTGLSPKSIDAL